MATLPHLPSYDSKLVLKGNTLKKVMEDGSFMARVKSSPLFTFQLQYKGRPIQEFLDIQDFYETYGETTKFQYSHLLTGTVYDVSFAEPVEGTINSFDQMDFTVTLNQWVGGSVSYPSITSLPTSGLIVDYDFAYADTTTTSQPISSVVNQVNSGQHLTASSTARPIVAQLNSHAVGVFDGVNDLMQSDHSITVSDFTVFVVANPSSAAINNYDRIMDVGFFGASNPLPGFAILRNAAATGVHGLGVYEGPPYGHFTAFADNSWNIMYGGRAADQSFLYKNGLTVSQKTVGDGTISDVISLAKSPGGGTFAKVSIARVIVYDRYLADYQRTQIYNYLKTLYAL